MRVEEGERGVICIGESTVGDEAVESSAVRWSRETFALVSSVDVDRCRVGDGFRVWV